MKELEQQLAIRTSSNQLVVGKAKSHPDPPAVFLSPAQRPMGHPPTHGYTLFTAMKKTRMTRALTSAQAVSYNQYIQKPIKLASRFPSHHPAPGSCSC